jgi:hypothetical protein
MTDSIMATSEETPDVLMGYGGVYSLFGYDTMLFGTNCYKATCSKATCSLHLPSKTRQ